MNNIASPSGIPGKSCAEGHQKIASVAQLSDIPAAKPEDVFAWMEDVFVRSSIRGQEAFGPKVVGIRIVLRIASHGPEAQ